MTLENISLSDTLRNFAIPRLAALMRGMSFIAADNADKSDLKVARCPFARWKRE